jgi:2,4-diaminopentanoate dehydrogenase
MAIRVAQIGTGNVGVHALRALITNPDFDLTGVWVSSESKAGKDAGELAGLHDSTGIAASTDLDAVLATKPQCAVYTAMADNRLPEALDDYRRILAAGVNVVGSSAVFLQYPWQVLPSELLAPIEDAAREGNSTLFVNGIDPGFANDLLPLALAGTCQSVEQIRCLEIVDYATYDSATVMFDVMGFGKPIDEIPMLLQPGVLSLAWGSVVRQLAAGLDIDLDEVTERHVRVPAPEDFDIASGHIPKGSAAALRFEVLGMVEGQPAVVLEHVTRLREDLCPDWPQPAQHGGSYRIEITGEPSYAVDVCLSSRRGDHNHAGLVATAMRVVNAIPAVVAAPSGIRTTLDLPLVSGRGLYAAS